ncbi:MAG TPA: GGDEF domain-containing protein [Bacillota bacterium]|nr:GGDEF domain-containing protein [Bacillota bacterium]
MTPSRKKRNSHGSITALVLLCLGAFYLFFRSNLLFFHTTVEGYSIFIAGITYVVATKTYKFSRNGLLRLLAFSCVGFLILKGFHLLTYPGMGIFQSTDANLSIQFWIADRTLESSVFVILPFFAGQTASRKRMGILFGTFSSMISLAIFLHLLPPCISMGKPLPLFWTMENLIIITLIIALVNFRLHRGSINPNLYRPLVLSLIYSIGSEASIILAPNAQSFLNFLGHLLQALSGYQIYQGIVVRGLERPFQTIFAELRETALTDPLTGLLNRSGFNGMARKRLERAMRESHCFGLLYLDVDNFKLINDRFGHLLGDDVLKEIAQLLRTAIRGQDNACRLGGDEFAIIADADEEQLNLISERIERSFLQRFRLRPTTRILGISIGMAVWHPGDPLHINQLINQADTAMYQSKKRNKVVGYPSVTGATKG